MSKQPHCFYSFETLDPKNTDPGLRSFVLCSQCEAAYHEKYWDELQTCIRCKGRQALPFTIESNDQLRPEIRHPVLVKPVIKVWSGTIFERPEFQISILLLILIIGCLMVARMIFIRQKQAQQDRALHATQTSIAATEMSWALTETAKPTTRITPTSPPPTLTPTPVPPTATPTPSHTPTLIPTKTATPEVFNPLDNAVLVFIPAGEFIMGSTPKTDPYFWGAEGPPHTVYLNEYWIYQTEVTNAMYNLCVNEKACPKPAQIHSVIADEYYGNSKYDHYPVIYVTYMHAVSYCKWAGGRLPTEAEWEKAARGTSGWLFPWGDTDPMGDTTNLCDKTCARGTHRENVINDGYPGPAPVGSYSQGASPYGVLDMAGNVWEWTFDWFQAVYYKVSPYDNPRGPISGSARVVRGGSWMDPTSDIRVVTRVSKLPEISLDVLGFRCVVDHDQ
jgi:formylglycine-generating enzyme required for sulfatase activity